MDSKTVRSKSINNKNKKASTKQKTNKKKKCEGPTCSMFLNELTKKLHMKKKSEEEERPKNIVHTIIDSISHALPVKFSRTSPPKKDSPLQIDAIQDLAPELLPSNAMEVDLDIPLEEPPPDTRLNTIQEHPYKSHPIVKNAPIDTELKGVGLKPDIFKARSSLKTADTFKKPFEKPKPVVRKEDASVNTTVDHDVASELTRHVMTLRKISLIAEEFNQKTARNLKEIVDSVQEDLLRKLNEVQAEEHASF